MVYITPDPPTLPNTGPSVPLSFDSHMAKPSPKRLCALPSTANSTSIWKLVEDKGMRDHSHPFSDDLS
jgi:hypothetical protein